MIDDSDVRTVSAQCARLLNESDHESWTSPVPDLDMSVSAVVAHMAQACLWYSIDLAAGGPDLECIDNQLKTDATPAELIATLETYAAMLAAVVETADPGARGFHPFGSADPSGFAAMACDEMLVHSYDAHLGLASSFAPDDAIAGSVLARLFPWVDAGDQPWHALLWANGRIELPGAPRLRRWVWHCAPLEEWTGEVPPIIE
ncbi:MAG: maleylpyruvate isomerase N-terminal domain-containing protein [Acidimicrobiales bacterium]